MVSQKQNWREVARSINNAVPRDASQADAFWTDVWTFVGGLTQHWYPDLSRDDVDDVQQNVWTMLQRPDIRETVLAMEHRLPYIGRVVRSEALKVLTLRKRERNFVLDLDSAAAISAAEPEPWRAIYLREALLKFSTVERALVYARFIEGRSVPELAEKYAVSYSAMATRLSRLFAKLRMLMTKKTD